MSRAVGHNLQQARGPRKQASMERGEEGSGIETEIPRKEGGAKLRNKHGESAHIVQHDLAAGMPLRHFVRVVKGMD